MVSCSPFMVFRVFCDSYFSSPIFRTDALLQSLAVSVVLNSISWSLPPLPALFIWLISVVSIRFLLFLGWNFVLSSFLFLLIRRISKESLSYSGTLDCRRILFRSYSSVSKVRFSCWKPSRAFSVVFCVHITFTGAIWQRTLPLAQPFLSIVPASVAAEALAVFCRSMFSGFSMVHQCWNFFERGYSV